jgi:ATP-binding cassette subfamily F protein 3
VQQATFEKTVATRNAEIEKLEEYAGHGYRYGGSSSQINKMKEKALKAEKLIAEGKAEELELAALQVR